MTNSLETIQGRIRYCISEVGTQLDFVQKTEISRSQLFRYLDGESNPPLDRLVKIANISGVDLSWLVTGTGTPCKIEEQSLSIDYNLLEHVIKTFEEALMEYQYSSLTPAQKSMLIPLIQLEMEHEKSLGLHDGKLSRADIHSILGYVSSIQSSNMLEIFKTSSFDMLSSHNAEPQEEHKLGTFINTVCRAAAGYFSSSSGENYCHRTQDIINTYAQKSLFKVMETLFTHVHSPRIKMLDLGCGSGRYMQYIHQSYERIQVFGLECSELPFSVCKEKERAGQLPTDSVVRGDARQIPYENDSFDFVFSKAMLHWVPYFKNTKNGANKVFSEVSRILKKGGAFYFDMRHGNGYREYLPFNQTYCKSDIEELAKAHGFKILWVHADSAPHFPELVEEVGENVPAKYRDFISAFAIKL